MCAPYSIYKFLRMSYAHILCVHSGSLIQGKSLEIDTFRRLKNKIFTCTDYFRNKLKTLLLWYLNNNHLYLTVRQPLQTATPPHWETSPMVIRAIPGPTRRRIARRIPNRDSNSVQTRCNFFSTMAWVDKKCISVLKPENRKRSI
jgi:hypothetical protein